MNNGRVAILHAYTGEVEFSGYVRVPNRFAVPVIPYGRTVVYGGSFFVRSSFGGFEVWSSLTHRGFHIDRDNAYAIAQ